MSQDPLLKPSHLRAAFRAVFRNPDNGDLHQHGRIVMRYLRKFCGWASTAYTPSDPAGFAMAFKDGKRSAYLEIQRILNLSDEQILALENPGLIGESHDGTDAPTE